MTRTLHINPAALVHIRAHGREAFPEECCGFLFGKDGETRVVHSAQRTPNIAPENRKRRYVIDPVEYMKAERHAALNGLDLLGIYHTHPNHPAVASEHDRNQAAPHFSYVILSVREGEPAEFQSWVLNEDGSAMDEERILEHFEIEYNN